MATSTLADVALTTTWVDLVVTHGSIASVDVLLQNAGGGAIAVVFGGADPSALGKSGVVLGPRETIQGNAAAVWARSIDTGGAVSAMLGVQLAVSVASGSGGVTEYTEDAVATGNPLGGVVLGVAITTPANEVADADYVVARFSRKGEAFAIAQGNVDHDAPDAGFPLKIGGFAGVSGAPTAVAQADRVSAWFSANGALITGASFDGTTGADTLGAITYLPNRANATFYPLATGGFVFNGATWDRQRGDVNGTWVVSKPVTSGGMSKTRLQTGTSGTIKASAGQLYGLTVYNANAAVRYLHLYNKASAPTLSTDTPVMTIPMLGASVRDITLNDHGSEFTTGIAWAYTTDDAAAPATAATSGELHFTTHYK